MLQNKLASCQNSQFESLNGHVTVVVPFLCALQHEQYMNEMFFSFTYYVCPMLLLALTLLLEKFGLMKYIMRTADGG